MVIGLFFGVACFGIGRVSTSKLNAWEFASGGALLWIGIAGMLVTYAMRLI